jgi:hypothetical protein
MPVTTVAGMPCDFCGEEFDPISTRWLCPHCHAKANCCDGTPLPFGTVDTEVQDSAVAE